MSVLIKIYPVAGGFHEITITIVFKNLVSIVWISQIFIQVCYHSIIAALKI